MKGKMTKWSPLKEMLFIYFAASKIFYWFNNIMQMSFDEIGSNFFQMLVIRFFEQDFLIIFAILFFHVMERLKIKAILQYCIAYVVFIPVVFFNMWMASRFFNMTLEAGGMGGFLVDVGYLGVFVYFTLGFLTIAIAMTVKEYIKKKGKETDEALTPGGEMSDFSNALICDTCKDDLRDKLSLFGQFVGEWEFEGVIGKGTPEEKVVHGEWIFSWILDGTAIQDVFICPSRKECEKNPVTDAEYGTTVRFYNQSTDAWDMFYGLSGSTHFLEGRQVGEQIIVKDKNESEGLTQWVFSDITPSSFHWQNKKSNDDGATWIISFELSASRKQTK